MNAALRLLFFSVFIIVRSAEMLSARGSLMDCEIPKDTCWNDSPSPRSPTRPRDHKIPRETTYRRT